MFAQIFGGMRASPPSAASSFCKECEGVPRPRNQSSLLPVSGSKRGLTLQSRSEHSVSVTGQACQFLAVALCSSGVTLQIVLPSIRCRPERFFPYTRGLLVYCEMKLQVPIMRTSAALHRSPRERWCLARPYRSPHWALWVSVLHLVPRVVADPIGCPNAMDPLVSCSESMTKHRDCYFELGRPGIWLRMDFEKPPSTQISCPVT